jgi:hypothetical protein
LPTYLIAGARWAKLNVPNTHQLKDINSPRRHEVHEEKPKKNLRVLRVFVVKYLNLMSVGHKA